MPISSSDIAASNARDAQKRAAELEEKNKRLDGVVRSICEVILDVARDRGISWHDSFDPLRDFLEGPKES